MANKDLTPATLSSFLNTVYATQDISSAVALIKQLDAMKVALDSIGVFREKSVLYAKLEAEALVRVCELGGLSKLRGNHRRTAEWLFSLDQIDRDRFIEMCESGMTIDNVYQREVGDSLKLTQKLDMLRERRSWLIDDVKEKGIVDMTEFAESVRLSGLPSDICRDVIDGARDRLRRAGAVGVGEDSRVYVLPDKATPEVRQAILTRYKSIVADLTRVEEIQKASGCTMTYQEFESNITDIARHHGFLLGPLYALADIGVICNQKEMFDAIAQSDVKAEVSHRYKTLKQYGTSRKQVLESLLQETNNLMTDLEEGI